MNPNPSPSRAKQVVGGLLASVGPLLVFYGTERFFGLKVAIAGSVVFCIGEIIYKRYKKEELNQLFWFSAIITIGFGSVDLLMKESILFKYEAGITSLIVGGYFATTALRGRSLFVDFAKKTLDARGIQLNPDIAYYLDFLTWLWVTYFVIKGVFYLWYASRYGLRETFFVRVVIGNASMFILVGAELVLRRGLMALFRKLRWLPSARRPVLSSR